MIKAERNRSRWDLCPILDMNDEEKERVVLSIPLKLTGDDRKRSNPELSFKFGEGGEVLRGYIGWEITFTASPSPSVTFSIPFEEYAELVGDGEEFSICEMEEKCDSVEQVLN
jgi:hypothetical protein